MNLMAIDYGTKRVGVAISIMGVISPLPVLKNDETLIDHIKSIISEHNIDKLYVGICEGKFRKITEDFVEKISEVLELDIETVEESVSTIEADQIYKANKGKKKHYKALIDSVAAAVILNRVNN